MRRRDENVNPFGVEEAAPDHSGRVLGRYASRLVFDAVAEELDDLVT
jgi:hypothetical protein